MTPVVFRTFKSGGTVIALFPWEDWGFNNCASYMHVGQHGGADYVHCIAVSRPTPPTEYGNLLNELVQIGYDDLKIFKRKPPMRGKAHA